MKKQIFAASLFVMFLGLSFASAAPHQEGGCGSCTKACPMVSRYVHAFKLSEQDSVKFKQTFDSYRSDLAALHKKYGVEKKQGMSDAEVEASIKSNLSIQKGQAELKEKYYDKFKEVLSPRQVEMLYFPQQARPKGQLRKALVSEDCCKVQPNQKSSKDKKTAHGKDRRSDKSK